MGVSGESQIGLGPAGFGVRRPRSIDVQRHARHANLAIDPRDAACYAIALLALGTGLLVDHFRTSDARDAVEAADAARAAVEAEQREAQLSILNAINNGQAIYFEAGIFGIDTGDSSRMCLLNPIKAGRFLLEIGRTNKDDPSSMEVLVVGVIDQIDPEKQREVASKLVWEPDTGAYAAAGTDYKGIAVGVGLPEDPAHPC